MGRYNYLLSILRWFKRKQKMQWNRQNAHDVLQLRSTIYSGEWVKYQSNVDLKLAA